MNYQLTKDVIDLIKEFAEKNTLSIYPNTIEGFKNWLVDHHPNPSLQEEVDWPNKDLGRSPESIISTLLVHLGRFGKGYSKAAIQDSKFSTQDEFIYLINLKAFGTLSKMELIKKNKHDKPAGMQIINRLIKQKWVNQSVSTVDKRNRLLTITPEGLDALDNQMENIRKATKIVSGNLTSNEKLLLIKLLTKLESFHQPIYENEFENLNNLDNILTKYFDN